MITTEQIEVARTKNGGWTKKQLEQWGVPWPPPRGWLKRLTDPAEQERLEMKKLYQEKSRDYGY